SLINVPRSRSSIEEQLHGADVLRHREKSTVSLPMRQNIEHTIPILKVDRPCEEIRNGTGAACGYRVRRNERYGIEDIAGACLNAAEITPAKSALVRAGRVIPGRGSQFATVGVLVRSKH